MHKSDVIVLGSKTFISTLNELSPYLKFKISFINVNNLKKSININNLLLCDNKFLDNKNNIDLIKNSTHIILPGVGSYSGLMASLKKKNLQFVFHPPLLEASKHNKLCTLHLSLTLRLSIAFFFV